MKKITESLAIKYDKRTQLQGVINSSNNEIIPCEYEAIFYVQKYNQFIVKKNAKYGILNADGATVVEPKYVSISTRHYLKEVLENGYYIQTKNGFGRITTEGKIIVEPKYTEIKAIEANYYEAKNNSERAVLYKKTGEKLKGKFEVLNEGYLYSREYLDGNKVKEKLFNEKMELLNDTVRMNSRSQFSNGFMQVNIPNDEGKFYYGYVDKEGKIITKNLYESANDFTKDGIAKVIKEDKFGAINAKEEVIIPFEYEDSYSFENGYALVRKDNLWGAYDVHGKLVLPVEYRALSNKQPAGFIYMQETEEGLVDINNHRYLLTTKDEGKTFFYYDKQGNKAPITSLDEAYPFLDKGIVARYKNKEGLVNEAGEVIVPVEYDKISASLLGGIGYVKKGKHWAVINEAGEVVTDFKYDLIGFLAPGYCVGKIGSKCTLLSSKGEISENIFEFIGKENEVGVFWDFGLLSNNYIPISSNDFNTILDYYDFKDVHSLEIYREKLCFLTDLGYVDIDGKITETINPVLSKKTPTNRIEEEIPLIIEESGIVSLKNKIGKIPTMFNHMNNVYYVKVYQKELLKTMLHYENSFLLGFTGAMMEWALYRVKDVAENRINFNAFLQRIQSLYLASVDMAYLTDEYDWHGGFSKELEENITDAKEMSKLAYLSEIDFYIYNLSRYTIKRSSARTLGQSATEVYCLVKAGLPKKHQKIFDAWTYDVLKRAKKYCYVDIQDIYTRSIPYDQRANQLVPRQLYFDKDFQWDKLENGKKVKAYLNQASIKENPYIDYQRIMENPIVIFE